MTATPLVERIDALSRAVPLARDRLADDDVASAAAAAAEMRARLRHGADQIVVGFEGTAGAG